jgi:protein ImuB
LLEKPRILKTVESKPSLGGVLTLRRGSERIESGWWDGLDVARDYFVAENPGGQRFWIFRDLRNERYWYVHGIFA